MALQIRRGTEAERTFSGGIVFAEGEIVYITNTDSLYIGDGSTAGGILLTTSALSDIGSMLVADTIDDRLELQKDLDLNSNNITGTGGINITGDIEVTGNIHATGDITADGNINIGNAPSDTVTITAQVESSITPTTDSAYDLGGMSARWRNGYFAGLSVDGQIDAVAVNAAIVADNSTIMVDVTANTFAGDLTGNSAGVHTGAVTGDVTGNVTGNVAGNLTGNSAGVHTGAVTGDVTGAVTGSLVGNVKSSDGLFTVLNAGTDGSNASYVGSVDGNLTGNSAGVHTGAVTGDVTGDVTGNLTGSVYGAGTTLLVDAVNNKIVAPVEANVTGDLTGNVTGDLTGNVVGNLTGDVNGSVFGDDSTLIIDAVNNKLFGSIYGSVIDGNTVQTSLISLTENRILAVPGNTPGTTYAAESGVPFIDFNVSTSPLEVYLTVGETAGLKLSAITDPTINPSITIASNVDASGNCFTLSTGAYRAPTAGFASGNTIQNNDIVYLQLMNAYDGTDDIATTKLQATATNVATGAITTTLELKVTADNGSTYQGVDITSTNVASTVPFVFPSYDDTARGALTPVTGMVIFNTTSVKLEVYTGAGWETITSA